MPDKMDVLVVGAGGREHALVWKLAASPGIGRVLCAPGNAGIAQMAQCHEVAADDIEGVGTPGAPPRRSRRRSAMCSTRSRSFASAARTGAASTFTRFFETVKEES